MSCERKIKDQSSMSKSLMNKNSRNIKQEHSNSHSSENQTSNRGTKSEFSNNLSKESDDLYTNLQDSMHDFGERVKKVENYINLLEKQFFIYNNDIENNNTFNNNTNSKFTNNNINMDENLLDYLKPILK